MLGKEYLRLGNSSAKTPFGKGKVTFGTQAIL